MTDHERIEKLLKLILPPEFDEPSLLDALLIIFGGVALVAAIILVTGWREDYDRRTTFGKAVFVASVPIRVILAVVLAVLAGALLAVPFVIAYTFRGLRTLGRWYRRRAFGGEIDA